MARNREKKEESRDKWSHPAEFFLTVVAYCVGPGNVLRFPYLCMRYGGGAFLIAYFTCLLVCGIPLFIMELAMGQSTRRSAWGCWDRYGRIFRGLGFVMLACSSVLTFYLSTYMSWFLFYFVQSCGSTLPWTTCNGTWNTDKCVMTSLPAVNITYDVTDERNDENANLSWATVVNESIGAAEEYFQNRALRLSSGIEEFGTLSWQLCLAHVVSWLILTLCLIKGIKSSGKVVWVTAIFPYVMITVFVIRAALLPGFMNGVHFYLTPKFEHLLDPEVWMMAFLQIFFSLGPGWGGVLTMASFNNYNHNFLIEGFVCPIVCCLTSFFAGFATFGVAGYLALQQGLPVEEALKTGPGIAFITYPELAAHLPAGPFWSAMFFLMMIMVLVDSLLVLIETTITAISELKNLSKSQRKLLLFVYSVINALFGLVFYSQAGMYIFQLIDWYAFVLALFLTASGECLSVVWVYGYRNFYEDICDMIGTYWIFKVLFPLWGLVIPALLFCGMVWSVVTLSKPVYGNYVFPDWSAYVGWVLAFLIMAPAVVWPAVQIVRTKGDTLRERLGILLRHEPKSGEIDIEQRSLADFASA